MEPETTVKQESRQDRIARELAECLAQEGKLIPHDAPITLELMDYIGKKELNRKQAIQLGQPVAIEPINYMSQSAYEALVEASQFPSKYSPVDGVITHYTGYKFEIVDTTEYNFKDRE